MTQGTHKVTLVGGGGVRTPLLIHGIVQAPQPLSVGRMPEKVRGLVQAVKAYECLVVRAAAEKSADLARQALLVHPLIGQWELAKTLSAALINSDPEHLGYLQGSSLRS